MNEAHLRRINTALNRGKYAPYIRSIIKIEVSQVLQFQNHFKAIRANINPVMLASTQLQFGSTESPRNKIIAYGKSTVQLRHS
ncbi:MAG: hypothetical protein DRP47_11230 [Candidatus Zixiibacteriota bacterium]|nr:MAG: hypothetical protein DRP47_11230 [candidate division Zixibacteria bacterium]